MTCGRNVRSHEFLRTSDTIGKNRRMLRSALAATITVLILAAPADAAVSKPKPTWSHPANATLPAGSTVTVTLPARTTATVRVFRIAATSGRKLRTTYTKRRARRTTKLPLGTVPGSSYRAEVTVGRRTFARRFAIAVAPVPPPIAPAPPASPTLPLAPPPCLRPVPVGTPFSATLGLDRTIVAPGGSLIATLANTGSTNVHTGMPYGFEQQTPEGWKRVETANPPVFTLQGICVVPGASHAVTAVLYPEMGPGRYRVIRAYDGNQDGPRPPASQLASAEFDVVAP
jgi:hypothetical protein